MCCQVRNIRCRCLDVSEPIWGFAGNHRFRCINISLSIISISLFHLLPFSLQYLFFLYHLIFICIFMINEKKGVKNTFCCVAKTRKMWCISATRVKLSVRNNVCMFAAFKHAEVAGKEKRSLRFCPIKASVATHDEFATKTAAPFWRSKTRVI